MAFRIVEFCTQKQCFSGSPKAIDKSIAKLIAQDENGNIQIIYPPLTPQEIEMLDVEIPGQAVSKAGEIKKTQVIGPELSVLLSNISLLASEIIVLYPQQNLRQMRAFFGALSISSPKEVPQEIKPLYEKKDALALAVIQIKSLKIDVSLLPEELQKDVNAILTAKTLLDIVLYFESKREQSFEVGRPDWLAVDPNFKVDTRPQTSSPAVLQKLLDSPKIRRSGTESTSKAEAQMKEGGWAVFAVETVFSGYSPIPEQRPFEFYIDAYGIDRGNFIRGLEELKSFLKANYGSFVSNPYRIWISDFQYKRSDSNPAKAEIIPSYADRYIDLEQHAPIFRFIKTYESAYHEAAKILHEHHPDISYNTWITFLMMNTFVELFWSQNEDPWQDKGASSKYGTKEKEAFEAAYEYYTKSIEDGGRGYIFGGRVKDKIYPGLPWSLASSKVPITSQGIGPNAVIIGDLLKAGEYDDRKLWDKYFPNIERTEENAVKIALDPALAVKAVALVYDVKLRELNETIFSNPSVKIPDDVYPTIKDPEKSREYFKLSWVRYCKAFPEAAVDFPKYFPYAHNSWNIDFIDSYFKIIQTVMGLEDSFPELEVHFIPSNGKPINDYFGDNANPQNIDTLMLIMTPKK